MNLGKNMADYPPLDYWKGQSLHYSNQHMMNANKIILDLCGGTGAWSKPYKDTGYDVRLITLPDNDVRDYTPPKKVHGVLSAPPCTYLTNAGALYWEKWGYKKLMEALSIVNACLAISQTTNPKFWALENPRGRLVHHLGKPLMSFNPCDYGDPYTKHTLLWGKFNPPPKWFPVAPVPGKRGQHGIDIYNRDTMNRPFGKKRRSMIRSITPPGFARAFFETNP